MWKHRLAIARTVEEETDALKFLSEYSGRSNRRHHRHNPHDHLSTFKVPQIKCNSHNLKDADSISELKVVSFFFFKILSTDVIWSYFPLKKSTKKNLTKTYRDSKTFDN